MLGEATRPRTVATITAHALAKYFSVSVHAMTTDHERDAALGALTAWAMLHEDARDPAAVCPLAAPVDYWVPVIP